MRNMVLLSVIMMLFQFGTERVTIKHDIDLLIDAVDEESVHLQSWEVVYIDTMNLSEFEEVKNGLQLHHSVIIEQQDSIKKTVFSLENELDSIDYEIIAVEQKPNARSVRVQIVIKGKTWEASDQAIFGNLTERLQKKYAFDLKRNFTCIKLLNNDIMDDGFSVNNLMKNLQVVHRMKQTDNMESSVYEEMYYGYSSLLSNVLEVDETQMNVHVTMRNISNGKKQIIIGTPSILNEY